MHLPVSKRWTEVLIGELCAGLWCVAGLVEAAPPSTFQNQTNSFEKLQPLASVWT